jgi:polysaccharide deacetylase family protein (PEP-CTERM system associated)
MAPGQRRARGRLSMERTATHALPLTNALSIDVEDYFQVSALAPHFPRASWESVPCRVERNVDRVLELLAEARAHATFFTLGWVAQRYPALLRRITGGGHEIASHGYGHERVSALTPAAFRADLQRAKAILEDVSGSEVQGYRAPSFSISRANEWAFDCIAQAGHRYSSSVYPVRHDHYGMPDAPRFAYRVRSGLLEVPVTTARVFAANLPAGGGGYFRMLPYPVSHWLIRRVNRIDRQPAVFYFHPWEIDPQQPRVTGASLRTRFRHYVNLHRTEARLCRLLRDLHWDRLDRVFLGAPARAQARA